MAANCRTAARAASKAHARAFNYPAQGALRTHADRARLGIKTVFCSNSFSAYRATALRMVGYFPEPSFFAEDQVVAGRMLLANMSLAYVAEAEVYHSHSYSIAQDFKRYFDVGVFHARNKWLLNAFGRAEGEGMRFVKSELAYLLRNEPLSVPSAMIRTLAKYSGYRLGLRESTMRNTTKARFSAQPSHWRNL